MSTNSKKFRCTFHFPLTESFKAFYCRTLRNPFSARRCAGGLRASEQPPGQWPGTWLRRSPTELRFGQRKNTLIIKLKTILFIRKFYECSRIIPSFSEFSKKCIFFHQNFAKIQKNSVVLNNSSALCEIPVKFREDCVEKQPK